MIPTNIKKPIKISPKQRQRVGVIVLVSAGVVLVVVVVLLVVVLTDRSDFAVSESIADALATPAPSLIPTASPVPSTLPTLSLAPTDFPSTSPSDLPTSSPAPTIAPSSSPTTSVRPSYTPSTEPSLSLIPSFAPTASPSYQPSFRPSFSPSHAPSVSAAPSFEPVDPNKRFRLRLYWQEGYYWQESYSEQRYCMECCVCEELYFAQFPNCQAANCRNGRQLWIQRCNSGGGGGEEFVASHVGDYIMIHLQENQNLCMTRRLRSVVTLQDCDVTDEKQLWKPISQHVQFELAPAVQHKHDDEPYCVTQHHHPKPGEIVGLQRCSTAHNHETGYWEMY